MPAVRHLGFVVRVLGPHTKRIWWSLSPCKNLVGTDAVVSIIGMFFNFASLASKCLFTPLKMGLWQIGGRPTGIATKLMYRFQIRPIVHN